MNPNQNADGAFPETSWSLVMRAGSDNNDVSASALEQICRIYWPPLYVYARRSGLSPTDSEDLTQDFLSQFILRGDFSRVKAEAGKLRSYLLKAFGNFMVSDHRKQSRQKRGGGKALVSIDSYEGEELYEAIPSKAYSPDQLYDRIWAQTLIKEALDMMEAKYSEGSKARIFSSLKPCITFGDHDQTYADLAAELETTESNIKITIYRLRKEFAEIMRTTVRDTLSDDGNIDEELEALKSILSE